MSLKKARTEAILALFQNCAYSQDSKLLPLLFYTHTNWGKSKTLAICHWQFQYKRFNKIPKILLMKSQQRTFRSRGLERSTVWGWDSAAVQSRGDSKSERESCLSATPTSKWINPELSGSTCIPLTANQRKSSFCVTPDKFPIRPSERTPEML